ncbi:hypothetical protein D3C87_129720 [compost metagenome]
MLEDKTEGLGNQIPPDLFHVEIYFIANGSTVENAHVFFNEFDKRKWINRNDSIIKNWKVLAWQWIYYLK